MRACETVATKTYPPRPCGSGTIPCYFPGNSLPDCKSPVFMQVLRGKSFSRELFPARFPETGIPYAKF